MLVTDAACATRLHDLTWECQAGDFTALRRLLEAQGRHVTLDGRQLTIQGPPMTVAILAGSDPIACFALLAFALFGACWPSLSLTRDALAQVQMTWQRQIRTHRVAKRAASKEIALC